MALQMASKQRYRLKPRWPPSCMKKDDCTATRNSLHSKKGIVRGRQTNRGDNTDLFYAEPNLVFLHDF